MMTAILLPVLLGAGGIAIDVTRAMELKTSLQIEADAAMLAAATVLAKKNYNHNDAKDLAASRYAALAAAIDSGCVSNPSIENHKQSTSLSITQTPNGAKGKKFEVVFAASFKMCVNPLTALISGPSLNISVRATTVSATASKNAFSMHLVLDRSSSMEEIACEKRSSTNACLQTGTTVKINALKGSVNELLDVVAEADPEQKYARFAAVEFSGGKGKSVAFNWGVAETRRFAKALDPSGGTNSAPAMQHAYDVLKATGYGSENAAHIAKDNDDPTKYIVFMTDGDNNSKDSDAATLEVCKLAKAKGIVIYAIAFDIKQGRATTLLSSCATSDKHYYAAKTASELYAAFREIGLRANSGVARMTN
ncbi:vWA domain-containing protein [Rhizobium panacihumi]|uniref:vWA domain-containing protein n=1 Tax=Rhizobium panacihumi TaxID=2008450 RepID=UPI003D7A2675